MEDRELALKVAWGFLGIPYRWGGNDPMAGFDCSGFIVEVLKSTGHLPRGVDLTANGLYQKFYLNGKQIADPYGGCLVFWGDKVCGIMTQAYHVEMCVDCFRSIGASGGGGSTVTVQDAIEADAYIKVRPFSSRASICGFADPFSKALTF